MQNKLDRISEIARENKKIKFNNLIHLLNKENLRECFYLLRRNSATGIDRVSFDAYEKSIDEKLEDLITRLKHSSYSPKPVRRVYIPKSNGKLRPLGVPCLEDKIVQICLTRILSSIYENDFMTFSYGFRAGKSCHDALAELNNMIKWNHVNYIIDADIKGFFENVDHDWMIKMLSERVSDVKMLRLFKKFLKNGYMEDGAEHTAEKGTPQGGVISPILANIYLHYVLDLWIEKVIKKRVTGFIGMVRYADDYIICIQKADEASFILNVLKDRLSKFKLELSQEKTKLIGFGRFSLEKARRKGVGVDTFKFLGLTHFPCTDRKGQFKVGYKTDKKKFSASLKEITLWVKKMRHIRVIEWWSILKSKISGHYRYFGISGNSSSLNRFNQEIRRTLYKWMNRRSQKHSYTWQQFCVYLGKFPLPKPKIYVNLFVNQSNIGEC